MYRLALLWSITGCQVIFPLEDLPDAPPPPDIPLRVWYTMDALTGTSVEDASEFDHVAVCVGGVCPMETPAVRGGGFAFDGQSALRATSAPDLEGNQFTLSLWMRVDPQINTLGCIASKLVGSAGNNTWLLCFDPNAGKLFIETGHGGIPDIELDSRDVMDNQFHHVALTYDGLERVLYVDGIGGAPKEFPLALDVDDGEITIGAEDDGSGLILHFVGVLDDFQIYDRALPASEILILATP